jgi:hypothetical protein
MKSKGVQICTPLKILHELGLGRQPGMSPSARLRPPVIVGIAHAFP